MGHPSRRHRGLARWRAAGTIRPALPHHCYRGDGEALGTRGRTVGTGEGTAVGTLGACVAVGTAVGALGTCVAETRAPDGTGTGVAVLAALVGVGTVLVGTGLGTAPVWVGAADGAFGVAVAVPAAVAPPPVAAPLPEVAWEGAELALCAAGDEAGDEECAVPAAAPPLHPVSARPAATPSPVPASTVPTVIRRVLLVDRTCLLPGNRCYGDALAAGNTSGMPESCAVRHATFLPPQP